MIKEAFAHDTFGHEVALRDDEKFKRRPLTPGPRIVFDQTIGHLKDARTTINFSWKTPRFRPWDGPGRRPTRFWVRDFCEVILQSFIGKLLPALKAKFPSTLFEIEMGWGGQGESKYADPIFVCLVP